MKTFEQFITEKSGCTCSCDPCQNGNCADCTCDDCTCDGCDCH